MKTIEMRIALQTKNNLLVEQTRRIILLEEKMTAWRRKYFQLKHATIADEHNDGLYHIDAIAT